ncbi:MAG: TetR family transcriptional regulator [Deltaproteobacteria bacterium]|nr:TetR family transcriptional regulator [Deltaproteobacteria bacterium]
MRRSAVHEAGGGAARGAARAGEVERHVVERGRYDRSKSASARNKAARRAVVAAASAVFAARGYAGASVEDVVRAAGISRRTFYQHFDDLADALAAVHDAAGRFAVVRVEQAVAAAASPSAKLERGLAALLSLVSENPGLARALFSEARLAGPRLEARQEKLRAHFAALLRRVLQEARAQGELARAPDELAVIALIAGVEAVGAHLAKHGAPGLEAATASMVRLARGACAAR